MRWCEGGCHPLAGEMNTSPSRLETTMALRRRLGAVAALATATIACSATEPVEIRDPQLGFPNGWGAGSVGGNSIDGTGYYFGIERGIKRSGSFAGFIEAEAIEPVGFGTMTQVVKADRYRGKR